MAEQIPFSLALLVIFGILVVLGMAMLAVFYIISTRTPNRFIRGVAPAAVVLLGIGSQINYDAGGVFATSALILAPVAAFAPPFIFSGSAGSGTGIGRMVACDLIVSLFAAGFAFYFVMSGISIAPGILSQTPVSNAVVFVVVLAVDLLLAAGIYAGMDRAGVPA